MNSHEVGQFCILQFKKKLKSLYRFGICDINPKQLEWREGVTSFLSLLVKLHLQ